MRIEGAFLEDRGAQKVCALLEDGGYQALMVGGCVRNALLGQGGTDIDIATDARPETVLALAGAAKMKAVPTGVAHGTVTLVSGGTGYEVTTFRRDVETDGRRATVAYAQDAAEDARRRDFTMNALYADRAGTLFDPLGGLEDLQERRVRFIGQPEDRIAEDYLRILRFFRFHAWFGDPDAGLDPEGLAACAALADGIDSLSRERVGAEMRKLLAAPDPAPAVAAMAATGILARLLPGADPDLLAPLVHLEPQVPTAPRWLRRLAALGETEAASRLRLSKAEIRALEAIRAAMADDTAPAGRAYLHGFEAARDAALLTQAALGQVWPDGLTAELERGAKAVFPIKARDLAERFPPGPQLGAELAARKARWIASDFTLRYRDLLDD
ncbi:CCA tRNA nucleotidyltransferase [Oceanomicrobium pacificus]|uniref:CCA tRNA nucleotidyltransferase n=1 Tax=Oceanomicrobium pacificus TaxID=2692916 RepID=A0A6B0TK96_9RHOB|nr:CCA tRNA nucleotidyltransferase [Oceanomicrobium pacificus]MXU64930.1 CCA tRNA nucleotidyltransferase [Oceanomicrobium pacificus]